MEELTKLIRDIRTSRRTPKGSSISKSKTSSKKPSTPISTDAIMRSLSPEQLESLIKQLEAKS